MSQHGIMATEFVDMLQIKSPRLTGHPSFWPTKPASASPIQGGELLDKLPRSSERGETRKDPALTEYLITSVRLL